MACRGFTLRSNNKAKGTIWECRVQVQFQGFFGVRGSFLEPHHSLLLSFFTFVTLNTLSDPNPSNAFALTGFGPTQSSRDSERAFARIFDIHRPLGLFSLPHAGYIKAAKEMQRSD